MSAVPDHAADAVADRAAGTASEWDLPMVGASVSASSHADELCFRVCGEFDEATAPRIWELLQIEISQGPRRVVLDLSETTFLSSAGITVLIRLMKRLDLYGGELVLHEPTPTARKVLEVTGIAKLVTIS